MKKMQMLFSIPLLILFGCVLAAGQKEPAAPRPNTLRAGTARILITPRTPIPMSGYGGRKGPFKGIHDELYARAIVFDDGAHKAVLLSAELIGFSNSFWQDFTQRLARETGIQKEYVLLSAVHSHGGPVTTVYNEDFSPEVLAYVEEVKVKLISATQSALHHLAPARIGAGKGECRMNINRRAPDGQGGITLGLNPYAPCDHQVGVIRVEDTTGHVLAMLMNWPCHAVVLGPKNYLITSDWPGAAAAHAEESLGGTGIATVLIGASGDINPLYGPHIDFAENSSYAFGKDAIGKDLAEESLRVLKSVTTFATGGINARQREIALPAKTKEAVKGLQPTTAKDTTLTVRLTVLKIGNIIFTGISGEVFNQIGVALRNRSPYANTFMITHCNGSCGYLVTEDSYPKAGANGQEDKTAPRGGYEPNSTRVKTGAEKAIISHLLDMIQEL